MKTLKYIAFTLAVAFAFAGCASGSGTHNFDTFEDSTQHEISS